MNKHLRRTVIGGLAIGALVGGGLWIYYGHFYTPNFSVVQDGVLYRSGQPDLGDMRRLRDTYGIRTVVNLRREKEQDGREGPSIDEERAEVDRLGMRHIHMPLDGDKPVDPNAVARWLEIVQDKANAPVLVHCKQGVDRTGLMVAAFRKTIQGWSPERALAEAVEHRMDAGKKSPIKDYILACPSPK